VFDCTAQKLVWIYYKDKSNFTEEHLNMSKYMCCKRFFCSVDVC